MARKRLPSKLHLLSVREVQTAPDGDHSDGGGLLLRVRGESASWVLRYTAPTGRSSRLTPLRPCPRETSCRAAAAPS